MKSKKQNGKSIRIIAENLKMERIGLFRYDYAFTAFGSALHDGFGRQPQGVRRMAIRPIKGHFDKNAVPFVRAA